MNDRDLFINWLYNNDQNEISDCMCVLALDLYDAKTDIGLEDDKEISECIKEIINNGC